MVEISFSTTWPAPGERSAAARPGGAWPATSCAKSCRRAVIFVRCPSNAKLAEEAPLAYKDVDKVVEVVHRAGIARKVAGPQPLGVLKG